MTRVPPASVAPLVLVVGLCLVAGGSAEPGITALVGRIAAVGIPEAGAVSAVGRFHPGGPFSDKPASRAFTRPGAVLDPDRVLVASSSNFGAPIARREHPQGAVLSVDATGHELIRVPPNFAASGGQATALAGRVILYTANSPDFLNRICNPGAVTADHPSVSHPTGISINHAFGRIWVTSAPSGVMGAGVHAILDPDGRPLEEAPNHTAGGIFFGALTNRSPQRVPGSMAFGALATAFLGKSPDGSGRAVFAGLHADGSLVQVHAAEGVDGLAACDTIPRRTTGAPATRAGMVFNWVPNAILYVADPAGNSIVVLTLRTDSHTFRVERTRRLTASALDVPVDIAPAVAEVGSPVFSSNTTLAGGADLYVANRGNGTIVRLTQDGVVVAIRRVAVSGLPDLGADRLNGIGVSPDAGHLWITVTGSLPGYPEGALIELPAFGASSSPRP